MDSNEFGLCKLTVSETTTKTVAITLDQINARFVDETMRGDYNYAPIMFFVTKLEKQAD